MSRDRIERWIDRFHSLEMMGFNVGKPLPPVGSLIFVIALFGLVVEGTLRVEPLASRLFFSVSYSVFALLGASFAIAGAGGLGTLFFEFYARKRRIGPTLYGVLTDLAWLLVGSIFAGGAAIAAFDAWTRQIW